MKKTGVILFVLLTIGISYFLLTDRRGKHDAVIETEISPEKSGKVIPADFLADQLAEYGMLYGAAVGINGARTKAYEKFEELKKIAKDSDLIRLMKRKDPIVKASAFSILAERGSKEMMPIFEENINDKTVFKIFGGCIISRTYVNAYLLACMKYRIDKKIFEKYRKTVVAMYPKMNDWELMELGLASL
ncbi:MAG: hypothetical protein HOP10_05975 [Chitinophagaceae bacterium]|nr:hypothetical protein [Chitinophagaceae bacterium]